MSEQNSSEAKQAELKQTAYASEQTPPSHRAPQKSGTDALGFRLDAAHPNLAGNHYETAARQSIAQNQTSSAGQATSPASERELQLQARQIAQHLRSQFAELDRREKNLNEQMAALDQEQRAARLHMQQFENELNERENSLRGKEVELEQRLEKCEKLVQSLDEKQAELDLESVDYERLKKQYKEELERELLHNWDALNGSPRQTPNTVAPQEDEQQVHSDSNNTPENVLMPADWETKLAEEKEKLRAEIVAELNASYEADLHFQLEEERQAIEEERLGWQEQKAAEVAEIERERTLTAEATKRAQDQLEELRLQQQAEFETLRELNDTVLADKQNNLENEFSAEREVYATQLEEARQQILDLQAALQQTEIQLNSQVSRNRVLETEIEQKELTSERSESEWETQLSEAIQEKEQEFEAELTQKKFEWEKNLTVQFDRQLEQKEEEWQQLTTEQQEELQTQLKQQTERSQLLDEELTQLRQEHSELQAEVEENRNKQDELTTLSEEGDLTQHREELLQLKKDQTLAEQRLRFREDHLQKLRGELEQQQQDLQATQQKITGEKQELINQNELQSKQLKRYREILEQREHSLEREQNTLNEIRQTLEADLNKEKTQLYEERADWEAQRQADHEDLNRQLEWLQTETKSLNERKERLDELRAELEEKHQLNLDLQLSIEQIRAEVTNQLDEDEANKRIEQAREQLASVLAEDRQEISNLRDDLEQDLLDLERDKETFQANKVELLTNFDTQRDELNRRRNELQEELTSIRSRESAWSKVREGWTKEKLEAESVIRSLLQQLSEQQDESLSETSLHEEEKPLPTLSVEDLKKSIKIQRPA